MTVDNLHSLAECTTGGPSPDMKCAAAWKKLVSRLVLQPLDESLTSDAAAGPVDDRPDFDTQESADLRDFVSF